VILHGRSSTMLRRSIIVAVAAAVPALAGCEAGANAPTQQWHQPTAGASVSIASGSAGQIAISNVFVLGAQRDTPLPAGSTAGMYLALVNTGPRDRLVSISAPGTAASVRLPANGITLPKDQSVLLTGPAPRVVLDSLTRGLVGGQDIRLIMNFQNAGSVTLTVPVMPRAQYYATFSPAPAIPTLTPTPKKSGSANASPSSSASVTATPSATPSPSATP
jgi:copper(I)-binding protein